MSRRRLDPDSLTRPLTIKISTAQHAMWSIAAAREDVSLGEWLRRLGEIAIARGSTR